MAKAVANCITNNCVTHDRAESGSVAFLGGPRSWRQGAEAALVAGLVWRDRARQRRELMELDGRLLKDIGVSRAEAEFEARKPFWRA